MQMATVNPADLSGWVTVKEYGDDTTLEVLFEAGLPVRASVRLQEGDGFAEDDMLLDIREYCGVPVKISCWEAGEAENEQVAFLEIAGEKLDAPPLVFEWEEFSKWRWVSQNAQEFDHQDPEFDLDEFASVVFDRLAYDFQVTDSSNNHKRVEAEVLVGSTQSATALRQKLGALGIQFSERPVEPEQSGYTVVPDDGEGGGAVYYVKDAWYWI